MSDNLSLSVFLSSSILVGGFILQFIGIWIAVRMFQRSLKKDNEDKFELKLDTTVFNEYKKNAEKMNATITEDIKTLDEKNTISHFRLSEETERYYGILERQMETGRRENSEKLGMLIELVKEIGK